MRSGNVKILKSAARTHLLMKTRTSYTPDEKLAVSALKKCRFPIGSWDKRFAKQLGDDGLTEKERPQLWRLFIRYRRQISTYDKSLLMKTAERLAAPDLRKAQAAANEQARIDQMRKQYETTI